MFETRVLNIMLEEVIPSENTLSHIKDKINKHFLAENFDELIESLEKEGSSWALEVLEEIRNNNDLLNRITFESVKRARNCTFVESLRQEIRVLKKFLINKNLEVNDYFVNDESEIHLHAPDYALIPTKSYKEIYPDYFRVFINKNIRAQPCMHDNFDLYVRKYLLEN